MSKNTGTSELINYFDLGANGDVGIAGSLDINTILQATTDTDKFLVSDTGIIKYRTGAELLADIGAAPATGGGYLPLTGGILTGTTRMDGSGGTTPSITMIFNSGVNRLLAPLLRLYGATNESSNYIELFGSSATSNRTINFPDASGTVALTSNIPANPVGGTGSAGQVAYWTGTNTQSGNNNFFWDNSTGRLRVNSSIANSNLTISGSDNTDIFTVLSGPNSRLHVGTVTSPNNDVYIHSQNNYNLKLGTNNSDYLTILNDGNVGIGTTTPTSSFNSRLAVRNEDAANNPTLTLFKNITSASSEDIFRVQSWNGAFNTVASIKANGSANFRGDLVSNGGAGATRFIITSAGPGDGLGVLYDASSVARIQLYTNGVSYFNGGNVMIGTPTDNGYKLYVNGLVGTSSSVTAQSYIASTPGLSVANFGFLSQTISGQMTILGHNLRASNSVTNQVDVVNGGWFSSMIKMYYTEGITFHTSNNIYAAGAVYPYAALEAMRIAINGNVGIGTTNPTTKFQVNGTNVPATIYSDNNSLCLGLGYQGVLSGYVGGISSALYAYSTNGGYVLLNSSSAWVPASDIKRKRNFEPYTKGLSAILGLQPKLYNMDFQKDGDEKQVGLVAQEVRDFIPLAYEENADFIGINYNAVIVTMVKAIQEQQQQIQELKNKLL